MNGLNIRQLAGPAADLGALHARHFPIDEGDKGVLRGSSKDLQGCGPIVGFRHRVMFRDEDRVEKMTAGGIVVGHKNVHDFILTIR